MKISYNWLKQFVHIEKSPQELSLILTDIGLEVESLEKVQAVVGGLEGLLIGEVKSCAQHPNADRLRVTQVDVGGEALLHIVCGAPNVAAGQKVVVAPVGATVFPLEAEPFKIKESKIRGELSQGMICAEDEIGLGKGHDGIMVLEEQAAVGLLAKNFFNLPDDYVYEIGLTPNRADAASHLGVARDLAAFFRTSPIEINTDAFKVNHQNLNIQVEVEDTAACPRYSSLCISGVRVAESPSWLKDQLKVIGIRPINNIVDITNYVLHGLGQPLHAFDADKITGQKVLVKKGLDQTSFLTLDGLERKLSAEDLMICNAEQPMCIAGVFGGASSGITESTTNVFLESAYFNAVSVRKTSKRHGLKTDASFRYERGTDPEITVLALKYAALLIQEIAGGEIASEISDIYPQPVEPYRFDVAYKGITRLIGADIPHEEIKAIILALGIRVSKEDEAVLSLEVPSYKVDVTRECDITEEVLRIYGYNQIAIPSKINASLAYTQKPDKEFVQNTIADMLSAQGYYEIWCNSLTKLSYSKNSEEAVQILNPLSSDLNAMRQSLLHPALESVAYNIKHKTADVKFYEFGKSYHFVEGKYKERQHLALILSGANEKEQWNQKPQAVDFYSIKAVVDAVLNRLGINTYQTDESQNPELSYGLKYFRGPQSLVEFGAVHPRELQLTDVDKPVYYAVFDWELILQAIRKNRILNQEVSKYPAVRRDLSMLIDQSVSFDTLKSIAFKTDKKLIKSVQIFDVYVGAKLPEGKKSYALNFTLQDPNQTLNDKQIEGVMDKLIQNFTQQAKAEIRK